jgi:hypothetical protein
MEGEYRVVQDHVQTGPPSNFLRERERKREREREPCMALYFGVKITQ